MADSGSARTILFKFGCAGRIVCKLFASFGVVLIASTSKVAGLLGLVGLILRLPSDFWLGSGPQLEAGSWALVIIVGELLLVLAEISNLFWPIVWSILEFWRSWLVIIVGEALVVVAVLEAGGRSLVIVGDGKNF